MKKLALVAIASMIAVTGAVSTASASLSDRDNPVWHQKSVVQVAARGGDKGGRNDGGNSNNNNGGRNAHHDKKGDKVIWRIRDGKHRPFWLFRHDRGEDCFVRKMRVENADGSVSTRNVHMCE